MREIFGRIVYGKNQPTFEIQTTNIVPMISFEKKTSFVRALDELSK